MARAAKPNLIDVLERHQPAKVVDTTAKRDAYLRRLEDLYATIRGYLTEAQRRGLARVTAGGSVTLSEPGVDPYQAPVLYVDVGSRRVRFSPKGFAVIGAEGRVDVDAGEKIAMLVHLKSGWAFARRQPRVASFALTESSFAEAMDQLLARP